MMGGRQTDCDRATFPRALGHFPNCAHRIVAAEGCDLHVWDLRSAVVAGGARPAVTLAATHSLPLQSLDWNPNVPNQLATAGEDGCFRVWDLKRASNTRSEQACLLYHPQTHSHWVSSVRYNPFHDQLLVTAGTDGVVHLWRVEGVGAGAAGTDAARKPPRNLKSVSGEDALYSVAWSGAWVYASVGWEGVLSVHRCPIEEKYRILL